MRKFFNFVLGAGMGALVGATAAILLAPQSGDNLRMEMRSRFKRFQDELQEAAGQRRTELERQLANMRMPQHSDIPLEEKQGN